MATTDSVRRSGYVMALVLGLIAMFALMTGNGWTAAGALLGAAAVIGIVERIAERQQRAGRHRHDGLAIASHQAPQALGTLT